MSKPTHPRVAILGAGPVGLEAALTVKAAGLPVTVYEQGVPGLHVDRWGFVRMFTPFGMIATPLGRAALLRDTPSRDLPAATDHLTGKEFRDVYLVPLAESSVLKGCVRTQTKVLSVGRSGWRKTDPAADPRKSLPPFRLLVRDANGRESFDAADAVLDCTGTFSRPNWVGDGGIPAAGEIAARQHISYWSEDVLGAKRSLYAGKSVAVIGGGYSAAQTACDLTTLGETDQSTWVIWMTHGPRGGPLPRIVNDPLKDRDRLAMRANHLAARCDGHLEYHPQTQLDELICHGPEQGFRVAGRVGGKPMAWEVERVVANVGYRPDLSVCAELRVDEPEGRIETGEPGYFVLGSKSRGRDSHFLLGDGYDQVRRAVASILGKSDRDLAARKAA